MALLNRSAAASKIQVSWTDIGYPAALSLSIRDLWAAKDLGNFKQSYSAEVPSHGAVVLRFSLPASQAATRAAVHPLAALK